MTDDTDRKAENGEGSGGGSGAASPVSPGPDSTGADFAKKAKERGSELDAVRSLIQMPLAWTNSPAEIIAACARTVMRSRWPRALTPSTQKPFGLAPSRSRFLT
jgi:hypothetical protein